MRGKQERTSIRILSLALNLLNAPLGCSRDQVRQLMGDYAGMTDTTFQRTFERDISDLRESGLNVRVTQGSEPRYSILSKSGTATTSALTSGEISILLRAAVAWRFASPVELSRLSLKLNARLAPGEFDIEGPSVEQRLEGAEHLQSILEAMRLRQPISFRYTTRRGVSEDRDVAALSLLVRGQAVYLWGYDFNRQGERHFRLSRISSPIVLVAEPDCYALPENAPALADDQAARFDVTPLLWVRNGSGQLVRLRAGEAIAHADYPNGLVPVRGWDLVRGNAGDWSAWETVLIENAGDCAVASPSRLRSRIESLLLAAAAFPRGSNGK